MADVIKWDETCEVGVREFDEAHKHLFAIGNRMIQATVANAGPEVAEKVIDDLIEYTEKHFSREEEVLQNVKYPGLAAHHVEHKRLMNDVFLFKSKYIGGEVDATGIANFLVGWIVHHIKNTDRQYRDFVATHGIG